MLVKALRNFKDRKENVRRKKDDTFEVTNDRFKEINSTKYGKLVKEVEPEFPKHTGGGWYELSNGEKIQGSDEALKAERELSEE